MKKIYSLACCFTMAGILLILLPLCSGAIQNLGTFKQDDCITLKQGCGNCTYNNITSINQPNGTVLYYSPHLIMTKIATDYNYTFCLTSGLGKYIVNGFGDNNGVASIWAYELTVTPSGTTASSSEGIVYAILVIVTIILFLLSVIGAVRLNGRDSYDIGGNLMELNYGKYLKMGLFFASYLFLWFLTFLGWQVAEKVLTFTFMQDIFRALFLILTYLLAPLFLAFVVLALVKWTADLKLWELNKRGLKPR